MPSTYLSLILHVVVLIAHGGINMKMEQLKPHIARWWKFIIYKYISNKQNCSNPNTTIHANAVCVGQYALDFSPQFLLECTRFRRRQCGWGGALTFPHKHRPGHWAAYKTGRKKHTVRRSGVSYSKLIRQAFRSRPNNLLSRGDHDSSLAKIHVSNYIYHYVDSAFEEYFGQNTLQM